MYWSNLKHIFRALDARLTANAYEHGCHLVREADAEKPAPRPKHRSAKAQVTPARGVLAAAR